MRKILKVFFEITNYCNFNCIYCFANTCKKNPQIMPIKIFQKIIDDLSKLNYDLYISISGGEPLSVKNFLDYGEYAKNFSKKLSLGTNGSLIKFLKQEQINKIKNIFDEVTLSFDTPNINLFKKLTTMDIEPVLDGINILNRNNIKIKLATVITKYNVIFDEIIDFCNKKHIDKSRFYWFIPREITNKTLSPSNEDYNYIIEKFKNYNGNIDIKIDKEYEPFSSIIISSDGNIKIASDNKREKLQLVGTYSNFLNNLKEILNKNY